MPENSGFNSRVIVRVSALDQQRLDDIAKRRGVRRSSILRCALREYLEENAKPLVA